MIRSSQRDECLIYNIINFEDKVLLIQWTSYIIQVIQKFKQVIYLI